MSKEDKRKDPIMDVEVSRIWYKTPFGKTAVALKYADPYGGGRDDQSAETVPIYVALSGSQPEPLGDVLVELERFRHREANLIKSQSDDLQNLSFQLGRLEDQVAHLRKPWWKRWFSR